MYKTIFTFRIFALLALLTPPVAAYSQDTYRVELGASHFNEEETIDELEAFEISAEVFFDEVHTGTHPYAEAYYLEKAGSLGIAYLDSEFTSTGSGQDTSGLLLLLTYIEPDSSLILQGGYATLDGDLTGGSSGTNDTDILIFGVGAYINDNSSLIFEYTQADSDINIVAASSTLEQTSTSINYKLVEQFYDNTALNFEASVTSDKLEFSTTSETNTIIELAGDYYFNQSTSIGASFSNNSGDDLSSEGKILGLDLNMFITPSFAVSAEFSQFSADNTSGEDSDIIELVLIARY